MPSTLLFLASLDRTPKGVVKFVGPSERQFREAYFELAQKLNKKGLEVFFADISNLSKEGLITGAHRLKGISNDSLEFDSLSISITPDIIVNRRKDELYSHPAYEIIAASTVIVNDRRTADLGNKQITYQKLGDYLPETIILGMTATDRSKVIRRALDEFGRIVIKPVRESGGRGVVVTDGVDVAAQATSDGQSYLLQRFIETNQGAEGVAIGRHDVRLYIIGGSVVAGSVRMPKEGDLLSNTALGGSIKFLLADELPSSLVAFASEIITYLQLPSTSFISLDFFYGDEKWHLIEVNDQPGIPASYQHKEVAEIIHNALVTMYTKAITL